MTVIWLSPMIFLLMNTLKNAADYSRGPLLLPTTFNLWHNITNAWAQGIQGGFINSLLYGAVSSLLAVLIASLAAFGIVRLKMPRALAWFLFIYLAVSPALIWNSARGQQIGGRRPPGAAFSPLKA